VRLAGGINAKVDIGELLESIKSEWTKLGPLIDLEVAREPQGPRTESSLSVKSRTIEHGWRLGA
jgi:hypothetical protein